MIIEKRTIVWTDRIAPRETILRSLILYVSGKEVGRLQFGAEHPPLLEDGARVLILATVEEVTPEAGDAAAVTP